MSKKLPWSRKMYLMLSAGTATAFVSSCACSANAGIEKMAIQVGSNLDTTLHLGGSGYQTEIKQFLIQIAHYYGNELCRQDNSDFLMTSPPRVGAATLPLDQNQIDSLCTVYNAGRAGKNNNGLPFLALQWVGSKNDLEVVGKYDEESGAWDGKKPSEVADEQLTTEFYFRYGEAHYDSGEGSGVWNNQASLGQNGDETDFNNLKNDNGLTISIAFSENSSIGNFDSNDLNGNSTGALNLPQSNDPVYPDFSTGTLALNDSTRNWLDQYFSVTYINWKWEI